MTIHTYMIITFINIIEDLGISRVAWGCQYDGVPEKWEGGGGGDGGGTCCFVL